ncbi:cobyric acid synthase CobQ/L-threonine-O-3-phosphate decarboxylase [Desulfobaculum xiamenense]|uniref:Cobyric acid synthase n=1 Tax=Desulfobaculum xiamenense TaxID=995050 RepID=A0A846QT12_9BACT|nr:cobyric acid synthase [Desulfobaculum xiamenense]NJB68314.1 cobyric acid synthase CobQ/L-threonine-O-3-phosphate decarboxylase [Desulfobaculum xiamenense]
MHTDTHGGNIWDMARRAGCEPADIIDFSANINPLGPPSWLREEVSMRLSGLAHYPEPRCESLVRVAAERFGIAEDEVLVGNGSTEILHAFFAAWRPEAALIPVPAYAGYRQACEVVDCPVVPLVLREADGFVPDLAAVSRALTELPAHSAVFIGQPGNPAGRTVDPQALRELALRHPQAAFVVDEAFADFVDGLDRLAASRPANVLVLHSLTKFHAIPGLRLGLGYAAADMAALVRRRLPDWSVNGLAQAVGLRALADEDYARRTVAETKRLREGLLAALGEVGGLTVLPGEANFLLCRVDAPGLDALSLAGRLFESRIAIRVCHNFEGLDGRWFRVAVRPEGENARLVAALAQALDRPVPQRMVRARRTPAVMVQGTSSNAGKSVLATALCRILLQDGYDVAPFKAQNMSLNSFVTRDGGEMGRAQVTQAQACRLDPDVRMNPVLLKPSSDTGSQVIVLGRPVAHMEFGSYIDYRPRAAEAARGAYDSLAAEHEVMVLEGAGSPAEINLRRHDIVNMAMARYAEASVLLAGDIDRGGVFASFVGTMELLEEWERARVAGFVVNMFRGDESLLAEALDATTRRTGRSFYGVVPYVTRLGLPEEDSVSFKGAVDAPRSAEQVVDIACVDLPHISNFTDLDALRDEPDVHLRVVRRVEDLGCPHVLIVPGSKNVVADMRWLRESGLADATAALAGRGATQVVGICGGFQMLGRVIGDPHGVESRGESVEALGLLPVVTELSPVKTLAVVEARFAPSGAGLRGYEIHHGRTACVDGGGGVPCVLRADGEAIGYSRADGMVWGSYLHGLFDADAFRREFVDGLRVRAGHAALGRIVTVRDMEPALDRLADIVREHLDVRRLYKRIGLM